MSDVDTLLRTLAKSTQLSKLLELNIEYRGILIKFWRMHYPQHFSFVEWLTYMEDKENKFIKSRPMTEEERVNSLLKKIQERES